MASTLKTSPAGRRLIKSFEGFRRRAAPLPGGGWVIGHGHTRSARPGVAITEDDADKLLIYDLLPVEAAIAEHVAAPLTQNQFDALASLALNIGTRNFLESTVLSRLNAGRPLEAALAFDQWRSAIVDGRLMVVEALLRRRAAERALFLTPPGGPVAAPTPEVTAVADDVPVALGGPAATYHPDLAGGQSGMFELLQDADAPAATAEAQAELQPETEAPPPETHDDAAMPRADTEIADEEEIEEVFVFEPEAAESEADPDPVEPADQDQPAPQPLILDVDDAEDAVRPAGGMSWAELAHQRAKLARQAQAAEAADGAARREDLLVRNGEAEWSLDDDAAYTPRRETGAVWYALFLLIGVGLAAFGAWDTFQRATGQVDEAFVYGPAVAGAGALFMAIAGWFLIKRVLSFR